MPGGVFNGALWMQGLKFTKKDSTLLNESWPFRDTIVPFYMCDHEVTNAEYREFIHYVRDSMASYILGDEHLLQRDGNGHYIIDWDKKIDYYDTNVALAIRKSKYHDINANYYNGEYGTGLFDKNKLIYSYRIGDSLVSIPVFPDLEAFVKYSPWCVNDPVAQTYFWSQNFIDYPIVGVNWQQAKAYCDWRSRKVKNKIREANKGKPDKDLSFPEFRLPSEMEWEYAANSPKVIENMPWIKDRKIFPWSGIGLVQPGTDKYLANFGCILDVNGYALKQYPEDGVGALFPTKVKSYPPNEFFLYDMAGNVAEWTADAPYNFRENEYRIRGYNYYIKDAAVLKVINKNKPVIDSIREASRIIGSDDLPAAMTKIAMRWKTYQLLCDKNEKELPRITKKVFPNGDERLKSDAWRNTAVIHEIAALELHDAIVIKNNPSPRIVKGGSWADGPVYMMIASREAYSENKCSSRIGFRVAMTMVKGK